MAAPPWLLWLSCVEGFGWWAQKVERRRGYQGAFAESRRRGKPLLVVGEPDGEYPCPGGPGDVVADLRPTSKCASHVRLNIEALPYADKHFGAAFCSFTLEMTCNPQRAWSELLRVADAVVLVTPHAWRLSGYLLPARRWTILKQRDGSIRCVPVPGRKCNVGTRYGTATMADADAAVLHSAIQAHRHLSREAGKMGAFACIQQQQARTYAALAKRLGA